MATGNYISPAIVEHHGKGFMSFIGQIGFFFGGGGVVFNISLVNDKVGNGSVTLQNCT